MKYILNIYGHREIMHVSVIAELFPFDCLNFNDFFRPRPKPGNLSMEFQETYTEYI